MAAVIFPTSLADLERVPMPGVVLDLDGKIVALNAAGIRLVARPLFEVLGRMAWEFAPGLEYLWAERVAAGRAPGGRSYEIAIHTPLGAMMVEYVVAVYDLEGQPAVVAFATGVRPLT